MDIIVLSTETFRTDCHILAGDIEDSCQITRELGVLTRN